MFSSGHPVQSNTSLSLSVSLELISSSAFGYTLLIAGGMAAVGKLGCVVVAVDESEESMNSLRWALVNLRLRSEGEDGGHAGSLVVLHVQSEPSILAGINPAAIPFGGPSKNISTTITSVL